MNQLVVNQPTEAVQAERAAQAMLDMANEYVVDSPEMYQAAGAELQSIAKRIKEVDSQREYLKAPYLEGGRRIDAFFRVPLDFLKQANDLLRTRMVTFQRAEADKAAQAKREAEEAARAERLEQERIRAEAEREERRIRDEAAAAERKAQDEAAAARRAGDEAAALAAENAAAAAREIADQEVRQAAERAEAASEAIELAEIAPVSAPSVVAPHASGVSTRQVWKGECVDLQALICGACDRFRANGDTTWMALLMADTKALGQIAKALKNQARIPGVRVYAEESLAVRAA